MKFAVASIVAASFTGHVASQGCAARGATQAGNPIHRPLNEVVTAGTPFAITWTNTTAGPVSIELLQGPSTNVVPIACISEGVPNNGVFVYTFPTSLTPDVTHYGIRIIDDKTGEYQYSTQFGIRNDVVRQTSSVSSTATSSAVKEASDGQVQVSTVSSPSKSNTQTTTTSTPANITTSYIPIITPSSNASSTVIVATTHLPIPVASSGKTYPFPVIQPSKNMTVPASLKTSQTTAVTKVTASASASFSSASGTGSPIASVTPGSTGSSAPNSGAGTILAGSMLAGLGAMAALIL